MQSLENCACLCLDGNLRVSTFFFHCGFRRNGFTQSEEVLLGDGENREALQRICEEHADDERDVHRDRQRRVLLDVLGDQLFHFLTVPCGRNWSRIRPE